MKKLTLYAALTAAMLSPAPLVADQQDPAEIKQQSTESSTLEGKSSQATYERFSKMTGAKLANAEGEKLGVLRDLVINLAGQIQFGIVGAGGFLGVGEKDTPVPWNLFRCGESRESLMLNVEKSKLESAPKLGDNAAKLEDQQYLSEIRSHFQGSSAVGGTGSSSETVTGRSSSSSDSKHVDKENKDRLDDDERKTDSKSEHHDKNYDKK
jgi:sporulation protein YlmC with PRC-barrel domain